MLEMFKSKPKPPPASEAPTVVKPAATDAQAPTAAPDAEAPTAPPPPAGSEGDGQ
jgi:hypothetical protein